jgi:hypothetical protein
MPSGGAEQHRGQWVSDFNINGKTLRDMLSGRRRPTFGTVQAVCTVLGLTLHNVIAFADGDD